MCRNEVGYAFLSNDGFKAVVLANNNSHSDNFGDMELAIFTKGANITDEERISMLETALWAEENCTDFVPGGTFI